MHVAEGARKGWVSGPVAVYVGFAAFSVAGSAYCQWAHVDPGPVGRPAAVLTLLAACFAAFSGLFLLDWRRASLALGFVFSLGLVSELVGLRTGVPFGRYVYTERWWPVVDVPGVGPFPLQLPFAWMLVAGCSYLVVAGRWWSVLAAGVVAMMVDQAMEPAMTGSFGYWSWVDRGPLAGGSPVLNALGWFGVSVLASLGMRWLLAERSGSKPAPAIVLVTHVALALSIACLLPSPA